MRMKPRYPAQETMLDIIRNILRGGRFAGWTFRPEVEYRVRAAMIWRTDRTPRGAGRAIIAALERERVLDVACYPPLVLA